MIIIISGTDFASLYALISVSADLTSVVWIIFAACKIELGSSFRGGNLALIYSLCVES